MLPNSAIECSYLGVGRCASSIYGLTHDPSTSTSATDRRLTFFLLSTLLSSRWSVPLAVAASAALVSVAAVPSAAPVPSVAAARSAPDVVSKSADHQPSPASSSNVRTYSLIASFCDMSPSCFQAWYFAFSTTFQPQGFGCVHGPSIDCFSSAYKSSFVSSDNPVQGRSCE